MRRNGSAARPTLRERLTEREIDATGTRWCASSGWTPTRPQAAASAATCSRKAIAGAYLTDAALLETLVRDKLASTGRGCARRRLGMGGCRAAARPMPICRPSRAPRASAASRPPAKPAASPSCKPG